MSPPLKMTDCLVDLHIIANIGNCSHHIPDTWFTHYIWICPFINYRWKYILKVEHSKYWLILDASPAPSGELVSPSISLSQISPLCFYFYLFACSSHLLATDWWNRVLTLGTPLNTIELQIDIRLLWKTRLCKLKKYG